MIKILLPWKSNIKYLSAKTIRSTQFFSKSTHFLFHWASYQASRSAHFLCASSGLLPKIYSHPTSPFPKSEFILLSDYQSCFKWFTALWFGCPLWNVSFFLSLSKANFFTIIFSHFLGSPTLIPAHTENKKAPPSTYSRAIKSWYHLQRFHARKPFWQMGGQQNTIFKELHFIPVRYRSTETRKSGSCLPQTLGTLYFPFWTNFNCHKHKA